MHHAPAVTYPVQRSRAVGVALLLVWAFGGCALVAWGLQSGRAQAVNALSVNLQQAWVALVWLLCGAVALWQWFAMPQGQLRWDGITWQWSPEKSTLWQDGNVAVSLDLQRQLLLVWRVQANSFSPNKHRPSLWLWLGADGAPTHWHSLRCAVYSPAAVQAPPAVDFNA